MAQERSPVQADEDPESHGLDAQSLRALAHPVRVRLVALLRRNGPATASSLAGELGLKSGATSYHLRQLAAVGFIEEDLERGNGRDRWWRSVFQSQSLRNSQLIADQAGAAAKYLETIAAGYTSRTQQALHEYEAMPVAWREALDISDRTLWLTPESAKRLRDELASVIDRYQEPIRPGSEAVLVITQLLPELAADGIEPVTGPPESRELS